MTLVEAGKYNKEGIFQGHEFVCTRCKILYSYTLYHKCKCNQPYKNHKWKEF